MRNAEGKPRILLSEGSSNSARQTLYGLGRNHIVNVVDPSPWCQCRFSQLVRRWRRCPVMSRDPVGYASFVADLLRSEHYDVLFPTHEQAYVFSRFQDEFERHAGLAVPPFDAIRRVQNKAEFLQLLETLSLPVPAFQIVGSYAELESISSFPCYMKLAHSTASFGVQAVHNTNELRVAAHRFEDAGAWTEGTELVVQQPAKGRQSEVSAVFQEGRLVAVACADVLATGIGGGPALRVSSDHPAVVEHIRLLGGHLNWHGPLVLEYFYEASTQQPQYIEANPRIGEAFNAQLSGVNLCELVVQVALGNRVDSVPEGQVGVKSHNGFIILIADAYNGANRRQLLRQLWRNWTGKGDYGACESEMTRPREDWGSLIPATAVILRLLAAPRSAEGLSKSTVAGYSLPASAAAIIDDLPSDSLAELLGGNA